MSEGTIFLKNYMEDCAWGYLEEVLSKYPEVCKCNTCKYDIMALALNHLPPKYVVREQGELYSKVNALDSQYRIDIIAALTRAVMLVKDSPRHAPC